MKRFLLFLFAIFALSASAQELTVKSFAERISDLSASTNVRTDNNDIPCALVKVHLAAQNASFEGNVVGNVTYKTSEYWVYMSKGSKRLTVSLEGVLPLSIDFGDFGVKALESKITYVLTLALPPNYNNGQQQEVRTKTGWIIIDSDPQGASVYINNEFVGNTPLEDYQQPYGSYEFRVEKPNYHSTSGTVELGSSKIEKIVKLLPAFGSISVTCNVQGATVLLDGKTTGKQSPCTLTEVPSGSHVVTLQKDKYAPQQFNVTVEDGKEAKVSANLNARFAAITIKTLQGADILVDNATKGTSSCTLDMMEGYHDVEVRLAHHKKATKQIQVVAGQSQTIDLKPTPIYGSLDVTSTPRNAIITIDGKKYGETPFTIEDLLEGEHTVTLSLDGYASETKQVSISEGQNARLSVTLEKGEQANAQIVSKAGRFSQAIKTLKGWIDRIKDGKTITTQSMLQLKDQLNGKISKNDLKHIDNAIRYYVDKNYKSQREELEILTNILKSYSNEKSEVKPSSNGNGHEYVDLGLSVKWATCNVGADNPEDYGDYYAWGETETKSTYDWSTYKWCNGSEDTMTKYCTSSSYGTVDNKTTLAPEDDVAHVKWGGDWRMPTRAEQDELCDTNNCTWAWTTQGGKDVYKVTSKKNGNSIFLPTSGVRRDSSLYFAGSFGGCWSSSLSTRSSDSASHLFFNSGKVGWGDDDRYYGLSVRPVCP